MAEASLVSLALYGALLGWSVAWPPGPINAEIVRRGLSRGFWPAYGVGSAPPAATRSGRWRTGSAPAR